MKTIICPECSSVIPNENINISTNLAQCGNCQSIHKLDELVGQKTESPVMTKPPRGSNIKLSTKGDSNVEITLPALGFKMSHIPIIVFMTFWLGFVAFWTSMAAVGSIIFALFSIPFWAVGIFMLLSVLNSIREEQTIQVNSKEIRVVKQRVTNSSIKTFSVQDVERIEMKLQNMDIRQFHLAFRNSSRVSRQGKTSIISLPCIIAGVDQHSFFEHALEAEQDWVVSFLNAFFHKIR